MPWAARPSALHLQHDPCAGRSRPAGQAPRAAERRPRPRRRQPKGAAGRFQGPDRAVERAALSRLLREAANAGLIVLGILSAGMGLKGFLLSSNFIDGGVTGVSMLLAKTTSLSLSVLLPVVNLPFIAVGYRHLGLAFAVRSVLGIAGLAVALAVIPFPH